MNVFSCPLPTSFTTMLSLIVLSSPSCCRIDLTCSSAKRSLEGGNNNTQFINSNQKITQRHSDLKLKRFPMHNYFNRLILCNHGNKNTINGSINKTHDVPHTVLASLSVKGIWCGISPGFLRLQWRVLWTANLSGSDPAGPDGQSLFKSTRTHTHTHTHILGY